jgi:hypothetical protein
MSGGSTSSSSPTARCGRRRVGGFFQRERPVESARRDVEVRNSRFVLKLRGARAGAAVVDDGLQRASGDRAVQGHREMAVRSARLSGRLPPKAKRARGHVERPGLTSTAARPRAERPPQGGRRRSDSRLTRWRLYARREGDTGRRHDRRACQHWSCSRLRRRGERTAAHGALHEIPHERNLVRVVAKRFRALDRQLARARSRGFVCWLACKGGFDRG